MKLESLISLVKRTSTRGLGKAGQEGCDCNQDNAINSEDIQTSVVADSREVYQQGEVYNGTKKRCRTITDKGKEYQLEILFEKRQKLHARMTRKCKLIDQFNDQFKELVSLHKKYVGLLPQEVVNEEDD